MNGKVAPKKRGRKKIPRDKSVTHTEELLATWTRERPDLDLTTMFQAIAIFRMSKMLEHATDVWCQDNYGISGADLRVIFALRRAGKPFQRRPTDLFRALLVTSGAITKQVDRLSEKGYVRRLPDPVHAGGYLVQLTARGKAAADRGATYLATNSILNEASKGLTAEEQRCGNVYVLRALAELEKVSALAHSLDE